VQRVDLQGADEVVVNFKDGRKITSKDIKTDPKTDLAIVRVDSKSPLPYLQLGDSAVALGAFRRGASGSVRTG